MLPHIRTMWRVLAELIFPISERAQRARASAQTMRMAARTRFACGEVVTVLSTYAHQNIRDVIGAAKFEHEEEACARLATLLDDYLIEEVFEHALTEEKRLVLVPIPLGVAREKERGENQLAHIARLSRSVRDEYVEYAPTALVRTRDTAPQSTLARKERLTNVRGAFAVLDVRAQTLRGRHVVIFDDVVTTGATLAAAKAAIAPHAASVSLVALAGA